VFFRYFFRIRETGVEEWVFQECKSINDMLFRFKDKERPQSYVSSLADRMHDYPLDEVLTGPWIMDEWDPDLIRDILSRLVPENVYITVVGQRFSLVADQTEPWYGTKYVTEKISTDKIKSWSESKKHERLHLPTRNEFIPTDFELVARDAGHKLGKNVPANLKESALSRLWYKQDDEFLLPKACMDFELRSPIAYLDPHHYNLAYMFVSLFNDAMNEYVYDAELAGLWYSMSSTKYGISLTIRGYHEKQGVLLAKLASHLVNFKVRST
jgi:insulysin